MCDDKAYSVPGIPINGDHKDPIDSVESAIYRVIEDPRQLNMIVDCVISEKLHGSADSFHALIVKCEEKGDYRRALKLCRFALRRVKHSPMLYADIVEISIHFENPVRYCDKYLSKLLCSNKAYWDLRIFEVVYKYFYNLVAINLIDGINSEYYENAKETAIGMQDIFHGREDGHLAEVKLLILVGKRNEARLRLENLIFNPYDPEKDSDRDLRCPKCCRLWIKEFKDFSGNEEKVYRVIARGLQGAEDKDDIRFFVLQKDLLRQRLNWSEQHSKSDSMLSDNSIDDYNYLDRFEKGVQ